MNEIIQNDGTEDTELVISDRKVYGEVDRSCPWCNGMTLEEQTFMYEKVVFCTHCDYSQSKTI